MTTSPSAAIDDKAASATSVNWEFVAFIGVLLIGLIWRLVFLEYRPFHNDEGVNFHFINDELFRRGYYPYSHENYHGPLYFYITGLFVWLFGDSEFAFRLFPAVISTLSPIVLLPLRRHFGWSFVIIATLLYEISTSQVYYGRYAIHETTLNFGILWLGCSLLLLFLEFRRRWLIEAAIAFAIAVTTKETFIISCFALTVACFTLVHPLRLYRRIVDLWGLLAFGALLSGVLIIATFSGLFQWHGGLREMLLAIPQWVGRNESDVGHHKRFEYYLEILSIQDWTEPMLLLVFLAVCGVLLSRAGRTTGRLLGLLKAATESPSKGRYEEKLTEAGLRYFSIWTILTVLVYSYVKYKTPWLIIMLTTPMILTAGLAISSAWRGTFPGAGVSGMNAFQRSYLVGSVLLLFGVQAAVQNTRLNFIHPVGDKNVYAYVHTSMEVRDLIRELELRRPDPSDTKILVGLTQYWPIPYYLREYAKAGALSYLGGANAEGNLDKYDVLLLDKEKRADVPGWYAMELRISDVQEAWVMFQRRESAGSEEVSE